MRCGMAVRANDWLSIPNCRQQTAFSVDRITRAAALRVGRFGDTAAGRIRPTRPFIADPVFASPAFWNILWHAAQRIEDFDQPGQRMWPYLAIAALDGFEVAEDGLP